MDSSAFLSPNLHFQVPLEIQQANEAAEKIAELQQYKKWAEKTISIYEQQIVTLKEKLKEEGV